MRMYKKCNAKRYKRRTRRTMRVRRVQIRRLPRTYAAFNALLTPKAADADKFVRVGGLL